MTSTSALTKYRGTAATVFDLLGSSENDLTAALGWTLDRCPRLLRRLWTRLDLPGDPSDVSIALEVTDVDGRTDLELQSAEVGVVLEAKKGWLLPGDKQLSKYTPRLAGFPYRLLVTLSDSSSDWAATVLGGSVDGVRVRHLPWDDVRTDIRLARVGSGNREKLWLDELATYLSGATSVRSPDSAWTYCVVLNDATPYSGSPLTWKDLPTNKHLYVHAYGGNNGWPKQPPVFMAFRWGGKIRQVNRVTGHRVIQNLREVVPEISELPDETLVAYQLGPNIPIPDISTQGTYPSGRVWVLLDQLLTNPTLKDAVRASKDITGVRSEA